MSRSPDKRHLIITAAQEVFSQVGFDRARISDIARRAASLTEPSTSIFKSKDELLISLFEERAAPAMEAIEAKVQEGHQDPRERFAQLIRAYLGAMQSDPSLGSIITMQVRQSRRFVTDYDNRPLAKFFSVLRAILDDGIKQGLFRRDVSIDALRWMVFGSLDAFTLAWGLEAQQRHRPQRPRGPPRPAHPPRAQLGRQPNLDAQPAPPIQQDTTDTFDPALD